MFNNTSFFYCSHSKYLNYFKSIIFVLCMVAGFTIHGAPLCEPLQATSVQQQKDTTKSSLLGWLSKKCGSAWNFIGGGVSLATRSKCDINKDNNAHLQHMLDDNDLYNILEDFRDEQSSEVFFLVYLQELLKADELYRTICDARLQPPSWLQEHQEITKKIKSKLLRVEKIDNYEFVKRIKAKDSRSLDALDSMRSSSFCIFQALLQYKDGTHEADRDILLGLNNQVDILISSAEKGNLLLTGELWAQSEKLREALSYAYKAEGHEMPLYPLMAAFSQWCKCYPHEEISKLLDESDLYDGNKKSSIAENNKQHQSFFAYLNFNKKAGEEKVIWCDDEQDFRDDETNNIVSHLLSDNIIKDLISKVQTATDLVIACEEGKEKLEEEQKAHVKEKDLRPSERIINKINSLGVDLNADEREEYLQDCVAQHMKDSIFGKAYYGLNYVFNAVKSNLFSTLTEHEQSQQAVGSWIIYLQRNALKLNYKNKEIGNKIVIKVLKDINKDNGGDITIADAITKLVEQRFESLEHELAFAFLTGLMRTVNRERESYCYKPFADTDLHSFVGAEKEQQECDIEQKQAINKHKPRYAHVEYVADDDNQVEFESRDWLPLSKSDYLLKTPKPQQNNNADYCVINDYDSNQSQLHADWNSLIVEMEKVDEGQDKVNDKCSINYGKRPLTTPEKMLRAAIGFSVVLMCAQGVNALTTTDLRIININNVDDLNMIGKNASYPIDGNYELTDSFNASSFNESIKTFNGSINGNCHIIYNLRSCLVKELTDYGVIQNIIINGANTTNAKCRSAVVGVAQDNARISFIRIVDGFFYGNNGTIYLGSVVNRLTDDASIDNVVVVDSKVISSEDKYYLPGIGYVRTDTGGVVGVAYIASSRMLRKTRNQNLDGVAYIASSLSNITVINLNVTSRGEAGGVVGRLSGSVHSINLTAINTFIIVNGSEASAGGVVGVVTNYQSFNVFNDITCINITVKAIGGDARAGGAVGWYRKNDKLDNSNHIIIINSHISSSCRAGGVIGLITPENLTLDKIVLINVMVNGDVIKEVFGNVGGRLFNHSKVLMMDNINGAVYQYTMENTSDSCAHTKLSFVGDNCVINKAEMEAFSQLKRWDYFCLDSQAETTVDTDMILMLGATAGGISVLALCTYCGCQWFVGCYKVERGMDLIKRPITKVFCCCNCSEHSAVSREDNKDEDIVVDAEMIPLN